MEKESEEKKYIIPGITVNKLKNHNIIIKLEENVSNDSKNKILNFIKNDKEFGKYYYIWSNKIHFVGLSDRDLEFARDTFDVLINKNKNTCIVHKCKKESELEKILFSYWKKQSWSVEVFRGENIEKAEWQEENTHPNQYVYQPMVSVSYEENQKQVAKELKRETWGNRSSDEDDD